MYRDKGSQVIFIYARDIVADAPKTGDAGNITVNITGDAGSLSASSNSVSELDATNAPGIYPLVLTKNETDADCIVFTGLSTTPGVEIQPVIVQTNNQNVSTIDGNSTAADNLKLQYNGNGLVGDEFPATQAVQNTIAVDVAGLDGEAMRGTEDAATETKQDAMQTDVDSILVDTDFLQKMAEGDMTVDTTTTPWQLVIKEKGTANELIRKNIKTTAGVDITSAASIIGQTVEP